MRKILLFSLLFMNYCAVHAQDNKTFNQKSLIDIVKKYHPIAQQADVLVRMSEANVLKARGAFDPTLQGSVTKKELEDVTYYTYQHTELKIPTWYGIDLGAGIENVGGLRTDPQETQGTSNYAGVSIPLIKNLVTDKRRATLKQAKVMVNQTETERNAILNDLLYDALSAYWIWVQSFQKMQILNEAVRVNSERLQFTKNVIGFGERPGIDSTEAKAQLQYFLAAQNDAQLELQNAVLQLSNYTWQENNIPYDLPTDITPGENLESIAYDVTTIKEYEEATLNFHPEILQYKYKFQFLDINKKLKFQELLPTLNAKYNFLSKGRNPLTSPSQPLFQNNYQYGLAFYMPLRLSEGRAAYKMANLKIKETQLAFDYKKQSLLNKVREYFNTLSMLKQQITLQQSLLDNQITLVKGEETKFANGESSLFLINSRELKRIETAQKLIETICKYNKQKAAMQWISGELVKQN